MLKAHEGVIFLGNFYDQAEHFRDKRVLITGMSGFVGNQLHSIMATIGAEIIGVQRNYDGMKSIRGWHERNFELDLANFNDVMHAVSVAEPDYVFHLGAVTQVTEARCWPIHTFNVNAVGTLNLLEACRQINKPEMKIIVASSDKAYGETMPDDMPLHEESRLRPVHPYDLSKSCADLVAQSYAKYFDMKIQITRMSNIYGYRDTNWKRLIPGMIRWMLNGKQPIIRSDGLQMRQYLHVHDAVKAYLDLAIFMSDEEKKINGEVWNFAPDESHSVLEIVNLIREEVFQLGIEVLEPKILNEAKDETFDMRIDSSKAKEFLGWKPQIDLHTGLHDAVDSEAQMQMIGPYEHHREAVEKLREREL